MANHDRWTPTQDEPAKPAIMEKAPVFLIGEKRPAARSVA
jgi:hypothetical protein